MSEDQFRTVHCVGANPASISILCLHFTAGPASMALVACLSLDGSAVMADISRALIESNYGRARQWHSFAPGIAVALKAADGDRLPGVTGCALRASD